MRTEKEVVDLACAKWQEFHEASVERFISGHLSQPSNDQQGDRERLALVGYTKVYMSAYSSSEGQARGNWRAGN